MLPWRLTLFQSPPICFQYFSNFQLTEKLNQAKTSTKPIYMFARSCLWGIIGKYQNGRPKLARKAFSIRRSGTQYVAMITKLLKLMLWNTTSRALLQRIKHFWCKLAEISLSFYLIKIWLSVWCHHFANLHILKTEAYLKKIRDFSSYTDYLFLL